MTKIETKEQLLAMLQEVNSLKAELAETRAIAMQSQQMVEKLLTTVEAQNRIISAMNDMSEHRITNKQLEVELANIMSTLPRQQAQKFLLLADEGFGGLL